MKLLVLSVGFSGVEKQVINHLTKLGVNLKVIEMKKFRSVWLYSILSTFRFSFSLKSWIKRAEAKYNDYHASPAAFTMKSRWMSNKAKKELTNYNSILQISGTFSLATLKKSEKFNYYILTDYTKSLRKTEKLTEMKRKWLALEEKLYHSADGIFVPSQYIKDSLINDYAVHKSKSHVIGYGSKFPVQSNLTTRKNILFVGNDFERKGGKNILNVFIKLKQRIKDLELTIVGPRFNPCPGVDGVNYQGQVSCDNALSTIYSKSILFVLHPESEPFGLVFLEAMSHGLPCIGTELDAMPEIISSSGAGRVVPVHDEKALENAIYEIICDDSIREKYSLAGKKAVENFYNWTTVVSKVKATIFDVNVLNGEHSVN
ncbi:glycosyltransferase family 4 protein [Colwellia sp. E2M01]|uniref:glycosyltransferase family 4 protein n=1 Tax=Colwellia sp. E2M01 TaxID=2841561 RepID=UPI001C0A6054|nr:glycosyltransferase family 4 protein [Colwellia sp. E2M01]MBU2870035.1 glycosyltransferase family 4 protein [Colwellia sp. E2M01]